jgi:hypothetical protein
MSRFSFTSMELDDWIQTRNTIREFCKIMADFKSKFSSTDKNWEEHSLKFYAKGFTTGPLPVSINGDIKAMDLNLNFYENKLKIFCGESRVSIFLENQSPFSFAEELVTIINGLGIQYDCDFSKYGSEKILAYEADQAVKFWNNLLQIYFLLKKFKSSLMEETSNINFWPHHFDTAMLWFPGNIIAGKDKSNWSESREQMNFGFSAGDDTIKEAYFYITSYPFEDRLFGNSLPGNAFWNKEAWKGAVMKYKDVLGIENPDLLILNFFDAVLSINKTRIRQ